MGLSYPKNVNISGNDQVRDKWALVPDGTTVTKTEIDRSWVGLYVTTEQEHQLKYYFVVGGFVFFGNV